MNGRKYKYKIVSWNRFRLNVLYGYSSLHKYRELLIFLAKLHHNMMDREYYGNLERCASDDLSTGVGTNQILTMGWKLPILEIASHFHGVFLIVNTHHYEVLCSLVVIYTYTFQIN